MRKMTMRNLAPARIAAGLAAAVLMLALATLPAKAEMKIQEVVSDTGIKAWLVEDYTVPIVTIQMAFEGGSTQDPEGKAGMANLITGLFDEGAGDLDSDAFQERLDDVGAEMSFSQSPDSITGSMRMLAENRDEALDLLRLAITEPRFDAEPVNRIREQIVSGIQSEERDPRTIAAIEWNKGIYGEHPYARRNDGTVETLRAITPQDLKAFHKAQFARDNLFVGVVGAIDAQTLKAELDRLFGGLPAKADQKPVGPANPKFGQRMEVTYDLPQTSIRLAYPGVKRDNPDFYAAYVMTHILGGGSFSSRLYDEVREKRGLAYGVGAWLSPRDYSAELQISTATRSDRAQETLDVILEEVRKMVEEGPTEAELESAKKYIIGSYPIANFDNSRDIARTLVGIQQENLGIDYISSRAGHINGVTLDEVREQARKLLTADPAIMLVGPKGAIAGSPAAPARDG
ncbi:M16 family metallopeptidase [Zhengella sp. ZM62]|uniref:M16 family metallopeptidase n=1 Tax=Zhengella sedimenti TaxID=3390035 RepID=UPI0039770CC9